MPEESVNFERKSIHVNGVLTPEARAIADQQFEAAMNSPEMKAMEKRLEDSRRLTGEDMRWTATPCGND